MEIIAIHNIDKHRELQEAGEPLLKKKKWKGKKGLHLFYYHKSDKVVSVLNSKPSTVWGGGVFANSKF